MDQRTTGCEGKIRYPGNVARRRAKWLRRNHDGEVVAAYYCRFCAAYHIGHVLPRRYRRRLVAG